MHARHSCRSDCHYRHLELRTIFVSINFSSAEVKKVKMEKQIQNSLTLGENILSEPKLLLTRCISNLCPSHVVINLKNQKPK